MSELKVNEYAETRSLTKEQILLLEMLNLSMTVELIFSVLFVRAIWSTQSTMMTA